MTNEVILLMIQDTNRNNAIVGYSIMNNQTIYLSISQLIDMLSKEKGIDTSDNTNAIIVADAIYEYITALQ
jgi:hypothetical protein